MSAIIVAGGAGERLGGPIPKQFHCIGGKPILYHALAAFERCEAIQDIILVATEDWLAYVSQEIVDKFAVTKIRKIVCGGEKRQDSVYAGLQAMEGSSDYVAVHDAVRPFIKVRKIADVVTAAQQFGAAVLAVKPKDTIKIEEAGFVDSTPSRANLWSVQTPQVFKHDLLEEAHIRARADQVYDTDDAALVERIGHRVKIVPGDEDNIKITVPLDLKLAEILIGESV